MSSNKPRGIAFPLFRTTKTYLSQILYYSDQITSTQDPGCGETCDISPWRMIIFVRQEVWKSSCLLTWCVWEWDYSSVYSILLQMFSVSKDPIPDSPNSDLTYQLPFSPSKTLKLTSPKSSGWAPVAILKFLKITQTIDYKIIRGFQWKIL